MRRLIGVAGATASGKTTIARNLIAHFGADTHRFSAVLADIARDINFPADKGDLQRLSTSLRARLGEDVLARGMCEWVKTSKTDTIVVEGIRRRTDIEHLERAAEETDRVWVLLFVDADFNTRFARFNKRLTNDGLPAATAAQFQALDAQECEIELPFIKERAHSVIDNSKLNKAEAARVALTFLEGV